MSEEQQKEDSYFASIQKLLVDQKDPLKMRLPDIVDEIVAFNHAKICYGVSYGLSRTDTSFQELMPAVETRLARLRARVNELDRELRYLPSHLENIALKA